MMVNGVAVIAGPTASGKTTLAIELARELNGEIVSADSMQIYRHMNIGTAKATKEERGMAVHHMLDVAEPYEDYSVARYVEEAAKCCDDILARGKLPIITGGTGLYIDSLVKNRSFAGESEDKKVRKRLSAEYDSLGGEAMLEKLREVDPPRADFLHATDRRRIIRALEVYEVTGETITERNARERALPPRYRSARIVLSFASREKLYARIDERVDRMIEQGLFDEVAALLAMGVDRKCTAMQAIGYKESVRAVRGEISSYEAAELIKLHSRRYAKRQMTWFRRWMDAYNIVWKDEPDFEYARQLSTDFIRQFVIS